MILSDRTIREELAAGRIVIDPLDEKDIQPSSVDLHVDRYFRVFRNDTTPYIDPKDPQEDLTELVEVEDDRAFILHPGEFVLGSTLERVALPNDLVARLEGKSSMGRLGLLIHSSLPGSERVLFRANGKVRLLPIETIVRKQLRGDVVSFDPETFHVGYHQLTGWFEGPADRIYEVVLRSGRSVRVTAGHNLFTLDREGQLRKVRTGELRPGVRVAVAKHIPDPPACEAALDLIDLAPEWAHPGLVVEGPSVRAAFEHQRDAVVNALRAVGRNHVRFYELRGRLPFSAARLVPGLVGRLDTKDRLGARGGRHSLPVHIPVDADLAWLFGLYVAEGSRRRGQVTFSNTDQAILDRVAAVLDRFDIPMYRDPGTITACSSAFSSVVDWLDFGANAHEKHLAAEILGWPEPLLDAFVEGFVDGGGSRESTRVSFWSSSPQLVDELLYLCARLGRRASASWRARGGSAIAQVSVPHKEHRLLTAVPLPDRLLVSLREAAGLPQHVAARLLGYKHASDLNNIERRCGREAVRLRTLRRFHETYKRADVPDSLAARLGRLVNGDLLWDEVAEVRDTGEAETIFDIEVRPDGRKIENFLAGTGGVFVSNTAGFVDAGWDGHLTLELSNVANLPIAIYPGMKIGQISFLQMTTDADAPYGSESTRSKYQGQRGPTPSRYYKNFEDEKG